MAKKYLIKNNKKMIEDVPNSLLSASFLQVYGNAAAKSVVQPL